ncbi:uncharacterized protein METZ01_LOCUS271362, partial [marine metagenome]
PNIIQLAKINAKTNLNMNYPKRNVDYKY